MLYLILFEELPLRKMLNIKLVYFILLLNYFFLFCRDIPSNCDKLWNGLKVKSSYKTIIYYSSCFLELQYIKERCSNDECQHQIDKINSELILFDVADEIRSITAHNHHVIKWY